MAEELGKFVFVITAVQKADGNIWLETDWKNNNIPSDSIIMKLRGLTRWMERKYFYGFDQHAAEVERK